MIWTFYDALQDRQHARNDEKQCQLMVLHEARGSVAVISSILALPLNNDMK
jgi:hypothetical protein